MYADVYLILSFVFHNHAIRLKPQKNERALDLYDFRDSRQTMNSLIVISFYYFKKKIHQPLNWCCTIQKSLCLLSVHCLCLDTEQFVQNCSNKDTFICNLQHTPMLNTVNWVTATVPSWASRELETVAMNKDSLK